jgi:hypothetical protein
VIFLHLANAETALSRNHIAIVIDFLKMVNVDGLATQLYEDVLVFEPEETHVA